MVVVEVFVVKVCRRVCRLRRLDRRRHFGPLPKQRDEHVSVSLDILSKSCCVEREEIVRVIVE